MAATETTLAPTAEAWLQQLEAAVAPLVRCLYAPHSHVVGLSLRCLRYILRLPLRALAARNYHAVASVLDRVLELVGDAAGSVTVAAEKDVMPACFRLLVVIVRSQVALTLTKAQQRAVVELIAGDLAILKRQSAVFALLQALLRRRLLLPRIYDVMDDVLTLMVRTHANAVRANCEQCVLRYLLHYPLSRKRLRAHVDFFIRHLGYEHEPGRMAVLNMLSSCVARFPDTVLSEHAEAFYVALVARLAVEAASACRKRIGEVLIALYRRVDAALAESFLRMALTWLQPAPASANESAAADAGGDAAHRTAQRMLLRRTAVQVLGLFVDATVAPKSASSSSSSSTAAAAAPCGIAKGAGPMPALSQQRLVGLIAPAIIQLLVGLALRRHDVAHDDTADAHSRSDHDADAADSETAEADEAGNGDDNSEHTGDAVVRWQTLYHGLLTLSKISAADVTVLSNGLAADARRPGTGGRCASQQLYRALLRLALYPHAWVRLLAGRLFGQYFATVNAKECVDTMVCDARRLACLLRCFCLQLESPVIDDAGSEQCIRNLLYIGRVLLAQPSLDSAVAQVLRDRGGRQHDEAATIGRDAGDAADAPSPPPLARTESARSPSALSWLLWRLARVVRREEHMAPDRCTRRMAVLKLTAALSTQMDAARRATHLRLLLEPVRRVMGDALESDAQTLSALPPAMRPLRKLGYEVLGLLRDASDPALFHDALMHGRLVAARRRSARKRRTELRNELDPHGAAESKLRRNQRKLQNRKRHAASRGATQHRPPHRQPSTNGASRTKRPRVTDVSS